MNMIEAKIIKNETKIGYVSRFGVNTMKKNIFMQIVYQYILLELCKSSFFYTFIEKEVKTQFHAFW